MPWLIKVPPEEGLSSPEVFEYAINLLLQKKYSYSELIWRCTEEAYQCFTGKNWKKAKSSLEKHKITNLTKNSLSYIAMQNRIENLEYPHNLCLVLGKYNEKVATVNVSLCIEVNDDYNSFTTKKICQKGALLERISKKLVQDVSSLSVKSAKISYLIANPIRWVSFAFPCFHIRIIFFTVGRLHRIEFLVETGLYPKEGWMFYNSIPKMQESSLHLKIIQNGKCIPQDIIGKVFIIGGEKWLVKNGVDPLNM